MASIFGPLDKRQRAASHAAAAADVGDFSFEDRADLLNDLLEEDETIFPLLACPPEVLSAVLLLSEVGVSVRLRPVCGLMRSAIDCNAGLWCSLTARDFADLGGTTKRYRGLRTLADAWDDSLAVRRLEWDPLMICAPPPLRYALLADSETRRRHWNDHGHALGAGWAWFSAKVCRRMATSTFLRWASLQYGQEDVQALMGPRLCQKTAGGTSASTSRGCGMQFRGGRSDSKWLSAEAVTDIYETVQAWHTQAHRDMMRAHFKGDAGATAASVASLGRLSDAPPGAFSVTPTLDAAEAAAFAAADDAEAGVEAAAEAASGAAGEADGSAPRRGAASRQIEEAQLRLALELSRAEARAEACAEAGKVGASSGDAGAASATKVAGPAYATLDDAAKAGGPDIEGATASTAASPGTTASATAEPRGLPLRADGQMPSVMVFLKEHCLGERVDALPEALEKSIESVVHKMATASTWTLLYESITEELRFRARSAAHALCAAHALVVDDLRSGDIGLKQERMCLPIWRSSARVVTDLSRLGGGKASCSPDLRKARRELLRQAVLEWCELEDLTEFMDGQLAPLEMAIDNFRGAQESTTKSHTPHVRDVGRLVFRNCCLLDSRLFRPLCLAAYSLVHEVHDAPQGAEREALAEVLEGLRTALVACDVADDYLSTSKHTKDTFVEHLLSPIAAAAARLGDGEEATPEPSSRGAREARGARGRGHRDDGGER